MSTSGDIERRVRYLLTDTGLAGGERFSEPDMRAFITAALRDIIVRKPLALVVRQKVLLVAGSEQEIPDTAVAFLFASRNWGAAGTTIGPAIAPTDLTSMDASDPNWQLTLADPVVLQAMADPVRPRFFYVYPPQPVVTPHYIEVACSPEVTPITLESDVLPTISLFDNAIANYVCYRLLQADSESDANATLSKSFFEHYLLALGK